MQLGLSMLTVMAVAANPMAASELSAEASEPRLQIAQINQVEQICVEAVRTSGYRVNSILATNTFSGGAEVIMAVHDRGEPFVVGCDYSDNTSRIELYQLENRSSRSDDYNNQYGGGRYGDQYGEEFDDRYNSRYDSRYDNQYEDPDEDSYYYDRDSNWYEDDDRYNDQQGRYDDSSVVRNGSDAEYIAREVVGDQLGIRDPYSDVVRIDEVHRQANRQSSNRDWIVEGRANGAPFVVKIRSSDAYILDFELR